MKRKIFRWESMFPFELSYIDGRLHIGSLWLIPAILAAVLMSVWLL